jgi:hypothetical protein
MGDFHVTVKAVGGHGCERDKKDGETVMGCERSGCPDCIAREFVRRLKRSGAVVSEATLTHWPSQPEQVQDDLLTGKRKGAFR